jgi:hypothetical protein
MWKRRFVPLAAVNPEAIHVRCCTENGADAAVLQSVDQSERCRVSRQNIVGQISLANIRNMPRRLRPAKSPWAQPFFRGSASTVRAHVHVFLMCYNP